jgi:hypothetical protein
MVLGSLIWLHEWVANTGLLDKLLAGDTNMCAIVGILAGGMIGLNRLKQTQGNG